jgi:hypothetical protein
MFTSGGGGGGQNQLVSMAMSEASNLFEQSGASSGNKQQAVSSAAMTVVKLLVQSKFSGMIGGGNSGGLGSLMSVVRVLISPLEFVFTCALGRQLHMIARIVLINL